MMIMMMMMNFTVFPCALAQLPIDSFSHEPERSWMQLVTSLAISPAEEMLICCTSHSQIYSHSLSSTDTAQTQGQVGRYFVGRSFATGRSLFPPIAIRARRCGRLDTGSAQRFNPHIALLYYARLLRLGPG